MAVDKSKDYIQQLADHIKRNLAKGYTIDSLRFSLMRQGYSRISVEEAIKRANEQLAASAPEMKETPQITYKVEPEFVEPEPLGLWQRIKSWFS